MRPAVCGSSGPLAAETRGDWLEASRYLNMELLKEHKKLWLSLAA